MTVRQLLWLRNVSQRTLFAFFPALAQPDDGFAKAYLSEPEWRLYQLMDPRDRDHAGRVARAVLRQVPEASEVLVRAALLHDLGKSGSSYHPLGRILVHLYTPLNLPLEPRLEGWRGVIQRKLHHAHYGAELIRQAGGSSEVAYLVEHHHEPTSPEAALLKRIEEVF